MLTNLFPGPIPQAVYLNHPPGRVGDIKQEIDLSQQVVPTTMEGMTLLHQSTHSQAQVTLKLFLSLSAAQTIKHRNKNTHSPFVAKFLPKVGPFLWWCMLYFCRSQ